MIMEAAKFLIAYLFWSNCLDFSIAQECTSGSFYENGNDFDQVSTINPGFWYLNLELPSSCSGRVTKYEVMNFPSGPGSGQAVTVALWSPAPDQNGMYSIIPGSSLELSRGGRKRRSLTGAEDGSPLQLYVRKGAIIGVYYRSGTRRLCVIGQEMSSSNNRMVCQRAGSLDDSQTVNCTYSLDTDILIFAEATIDIIECPDAPTVLNGYSSYIDGDKQYGARAQYSCIMGHEIAVNGNDVLTCDEEGEWTGIIPSCQPVTCPTLDTPVNGTKHGSSYIFESLVTFSCDTGFLLEGDRNLVCQSDGTWNGSVPICVPVSCGNPGDIDDGTVDGNSFNFGDVLKFFCDEGYSLAGPSNITCRSTGQWSEDLPTCSIVQCQFPVSPTNGVASGASSTFTVNSIVTFSCNNGYALVGNDSSVCMTNRQWSNESPECVKQCQSFPTSILTIVPDKDTYIVGDTVMLSCTTDPTRQTTLVCTSSGLWNGSEPVCLELTETSNAQTSSTVDAQTVNRNNNDNNSFAVVGSVIAVILIIGLASVLGTGIGLLILWRKRRVIIFKGGKRGNSTEREMLQETLVGLINQTYQDTNLLISKDLNNPLYGDIEEESTYSAPYHSPEFTASYSIYEACEPTIYDYQTDETIYWEPSSNIQVIYEQLATKNYKSIPRHQIKVVNHLGSGRFGTVDKGLWTTPEGQAAVAIKTLKGSSTEEEEVRFLQEAAINGQFNHPNIVRLCGVVTEGRPTLIILEYLLNGDLKAFLENLRPAPGELPHESLPKILLKFSHEIACGMLYLSRKGFVHRDLAARNILVGEGNICKIADFGMSRDLQDEDYYRPSSKHISIPVKWTAPEAINYRKYSTQSDVWSFGVVLYEIWSVGHKPFGYTTNQECIRLIESGYRLPPPSGCSRPVYEIMVNCWNPDPSCRPKFMELETQLRQSNEDLLNVHASAHQLGGDPSVTSVYTDLQNVYKESLN